MSKSKINLNYIIASSLSELMDKVNWNNEHNPDNLILKEDIVSIQKENEAYILLYYR